MTQKLKTALFCCLFFASGAWPCSAAPAQSSATLTVQKSTINAETETPELCLEFNKDLAPLSVEKLNTFLHMENKGKTVIPSNIVAMGSSLCLFPLERNTPYRLALKGLKGAQNEKMPAPHVFSFSIPDRAPSLTFSTESGALNKFGAYHSPLTLRSVNIDRVEIQAYQITKPSLMARAWQDRKLIALAPSEIAAFGRDKGKLVWSTEENIPLNPNATLAQTFSLREKIPTLPPGLFLIVANAKTTKARHKDKFLSPLAAVWITNSNFSLRSLRDSDGVHSILSREPPNKDPLLLMAFTNNAAPLLETEEKTGDVNFMPLPPASKEGQDISVVIGQDSSGNVAFAPVEFLTAPSSTVFYPGSLQLDAPYAAPLAPIDAFLSASSLRKEQALKTASLLRLSAGNVTYAELPVSIPKANAPLKIPFIAPPLPGAWSLQWQRTNGTILAQTALRISAFPDTTHLHTTPEGHDLTQDLICPLTIKARSSAGSPAPLINGRIFVSWEKLDSPAFLWRDYLFGDGHPLSEAPKPVADFLTDLEGTASLRLTLPPPPENSGLYQARISFASAHDTNLVEAEDIILPLRSEKTVVGVKPLATEALFPQNSVAQFALVGLSPEGKPRDISDLFYQIYEEGRSFDWYQDEGRWKYKPEARLRPIGGGPLAIKADGKSIIEWPVTAGKYRLAIINRNGRILAQTPFSAGWDSSGLANLPTESLAISLPKKLGAGQEIVARVTLPESAMMTVIVSDSRIRKILHEPRPKGDNIIAFTPTDDWSNSLRLSVETSSSETEKEPPSVRRYGVRDLLLSEEDPKTEKPDLHEISVVFADSPSSLVLRKDETIALPFVLRNPSPKSSVVDYSFKTSPGMKMAGSFAGKVLLQGHQTKTLSLSLTGLTPGEKLLRFDALGRKAPRTSLSWPVAVLPEAPFLKSARTVSIEPGQNLPPVVPSKSQKEKKIFISRIPLNGIPEILSYVFNARPFTTEELALTLRTLHLWKETIHHLGIAPLFVTEGREQNYLIRLLQRQNPDGGFGAYRGKGSTLADTATALITLGLLHKPKETNPAKTLAALWIKQQLSNTWVDESEREDRAAAYAALATVGSVDTASLHYFSDTSEAKDLSPVAKAHIASAFKLIQETNAAALWTKKVRNENTGHNEIPTLQALSLTEAPPLADVLAAIKKMEKEIGENNAPELKEASALLTVISANLLAEGRGELSRKKEKLRIDKMLILPAGEAASYKNTSSDSLSATFVSEEKNLPSASLSDAKLSQHVYRLNGIEVPAGAKPIEEDVYLIEIKASKLPEGVPLLIQHGGNAFRALGCPLSPHLNVLSFIPWLTSSGLPAFDGCEISSDGLGIFLPPQEKGKGPISLFFFARINAGSISDLPAPWVRVPQTNKRSAEISTNR